MRHTFLVLIREQILLDKSQIGVGGWRNVKMGKGASAKQREGQQGVDLNRAWGHPIRQKEE